MKKIILIMLLLFPLSVKADKISASLSKCVDGDTAKFKVDKKEIKVRFLGINTPESVKPNEKAEPLGKEASKFTCDKLKNAKKIELEYDEANNTIDMYGRELMYVFVDDKLLEEILLKKGYAKVKYIDKSYKYYDKLVRAEKYAINKELGVYSREIVEKETIDSFISKVADYISSKVKKILSNILGNS